MVQGPLYSSGSFWIFNAQIYAFSHILETLFLLFLSASSTPQTDDNSASHCTLINMKYFYVLDPFFNPQEKVMPFII